MSLLDQYDLRDEATRECPHRYFAALRAEAPVSFRPELGSYYVARYADVRYVKKHPELFSNDTARYGSRSARARNIAEDYRRQHGWARVSTLQRTDPPVHGMYRRLINDAFTVARVRAMTAYIETIVNDLIDAFIDRGRCDFVAEFAVPLPCTVIADQLGVPREMIWTLKAWSDAMLAPGGGFVDDDAALDCAKQVVQAQHYFAQVLAARKQAPRDDIISVLAHAVVTPPDGTAARPLDMNELQDLLDQLLTGGNETTTNALGSAMWLLLSRPALVAELEANPAAIRDFVEEALRYETPVLHLWRVATCDTEIGGVAIPAGSSIALGYASANRDEAVFDDAESFAPQRAKVGAHLAFGSGPHHCPGAALARQEMVSAFTILVHRLRGMHLLATDDPPKHVPSLFLRGLARLDVGFTPGDSPRYLPGASAY